MDDLKAIFDTLKISLKAYQPPLTPKTDRDGYFDLWSRREVVIAGRKKKEIFFAGLIIQKSYVGFYYMPVYADGDLKAVFGPELLALLKGKSCFHLKRLDARLQQQIETALKIGFELYQKNGWV